MEGQLGTEADTLTWDGASLFVHLDFEFFPMRVHSGRGSVSWQGYEWQGIGDVLRRNASSSWSVLSSHITQRGRMSASLPISKEVREVLAEEYYRDRGMEWIICTIGTDGTVERQVHTNRGRIVSYERTEDCVTFTADCEFLDSVHDRDARHKLRVGAVRQRFKWGLADAIMSNGVGWTISLAEMVGGAFGFAVDVLETAAPGRSRRIAKQRWSARKRTYWFKTVPSIPGVRLGKKGYMVRADTLNEAKTKLYELVWGKIWDIPPNFISMIIYWEDRPLEFLSLDTLRQKDDLARYEEANPMRMWPP